MGGSVTIPATIRLFLVHGQPAGLRTAEISNWTGKAVAAPRTELKEFAQREELKSPGIYFLTGVDPETGKDALYIGEAESVVKRLPGHASKDFWVSVAAFVSKDENLTKAHIRYLEGKLIERAQQLRVHLVNSVSSGGARLPESDAAEMDVFLEKVLQLLPVLGISHLSKPVNRVAEKHSLLYCHVKGLKATGNRTESGFVVYAGSQAVPNDRPSAAAWSRERRAELLSTGALKLECDHLLFTEDIEFSSPSIAAGIICGGNTNGLTNWRNTDGKELKALEENET
ncbi:MAG TPA: DUF4357 domain-containing protein [Spongiibacteraceae bacterium]|nr:hypothetical protein [Spongiibacteraceae bacterium]HCS27455.1 DUF4357 domain-containing protein [Spongiibacteraceae bacterium]